MNSLERDVNVLNTHDEVGLIVCNRVIRLTERQMGITLLETCESVCTNRQGGKIASDIQGFMLAGRQTSSCGSIN